jgi:hypothetical protein
LVDSLSFAASTLPSPTRAVGRTSAERENVGREGPKERRGRV